MANNPLIQSFHEEIIRSMTKTDGTLRKAENDISLRMIVSQEFSNV
jgi:hypothetical protein